MQLPQDLVLLQCLSGIFYWLHNPQMNDLWKCLWSRNWATGFAGNKKFQRMVDYCPCRYWLLSRSSLETLPACPLDADQAICAGHPQWIFLWFFTCMIMKTLAWQSPFSELCVKKESIRLERWSLNSSSKNSYKLYKDREKKHTHTQSSTWWSEAPSQAVKLGVSHTAPTLTASKSQVYYTGAGALPI